MVETERLILRRVTLDDAPFILRLVNEPAWIQYIGDKKIRTLDAARAYITDGPLKMYTQFGFGLFLIELKNTLTPVGLCGLIKRDELHDVDIGFALVPECWGKGYGFESASAVMRYAVAQHGMSKLLAITLPENGPSIALLEKLGFNYQQRIHLAHDDAELELYSVTL